MYLCRERATVSTVDQCAPSSTIWSQVVGKQHCGNGVAGKADKGTAGNSTGLSESDLAELQIRLVEEICKIHKMLEV